MVDDSPTMLHLVANVLEKDRQIEVVGMAQDVATARNAVKELRPDVMTLDVEMPGMNGIEFLGKLMRLRPMPVIMVSTLTTKGSDIAIEALQLGAIDCVIKPSARNPNSLIELPEKIKIAAQSNVLARVAIPILPPTRLTNSVSFKAGRKIVAIGSSIGGVEALITILRKFPQECAPTVIVQHLPANFMAGLVRRLGLNCAAKVVLAEEGEQMKVGHVYLAPCGTKHLEITGDDVYRFKLLEGDRISGHRPSIDVLFKSIARNIGAHSIGVILTGMGHDGAEGLLAMCQMGAQTIGQNEATSVVYGMPKAAFKLGAVERQLPIDQIGDEIVNLSTLAFA